MSNRSLKTDKLAVRVNYVRDWLNKAEDAISRGDNIDAVTKLALAKADTTNLISMLIPQSKEVRSARPAFSRIFSMRRLATFFAPLILIGIFFLGIATGGKLSPGSEIALNETPAKTFIRSVNRPTLNGEPMVLIAANDGIPEVDTEDTPVPDTTPERTVVAKKPPATVPVVATSEPVTDEPAEPEPPMPVTTSADISEPTEDNIDLFGFGLDVIRSARENMGH